MLEDLPLWLLNRPEPERLLQKRSRTTFKLVTVNKLGETKEGLYRLSFLFALYSREILVIVFPLAVWVALLPTSSRCVPRQLQPKRGFIPFSFFPPSLHLQQLL